MTQDQKTQIITMRGEGYGYAAIAQVLSIPKNTIKTFCNRNGLAGQKQEKHSLVLPNTNKCKNCGMPIVSKSSTKPRKFCSDKCCREWFHKNRIPKNDKGRKENICVQCNNLFITYGKVERKYCSHQCYIKHRYGKGGDEQ